MVWKGLLVFVSAVFIIVIGVGASLAYNSSIYAKGCLIPYAFYDGAGMDTVVGVQAATTSFGGAVYWSFLDADGVEIVSNSIPLNPGVKQYGLSLSGSAGGLGQNQIGWILVTFDNDGILNIGEPGGAILAANCFLIDMVNNDAAVIPVVPLVIDDYKPMVINLLSPPDRPLVQTSLGQVVPTNTLVSRFLINPSGDPKTELVIFSPGDAPTEYTAQLVSASGAVQPGITLTTTNDNLNVFNLQDVAPFGFTDGAIEIHGGPPGSIGIQFSMIYWSAFGAIQTSVAFEGWW